MNQPLARCIGSINAVDDNAKLCPYRCLLWHTQDFQQLARDRLNRYPGHAAAKCQPGHRTGQCIAQRGAKAHPGHLAREYAEPTRVDGQVFGDRVLGDVLDVEVICPNITEAAALGAAIQAVWCDDHERGANRTLAELCDGLVSLDQQTLTRPQAANVPRYQALYRTYRQALAERYHVPV